MSGIFDLKGMEVADMLDVVHVLFEEDSIPMWDQHAEVRSNVRETIYQQLYDRPYKYKLSGSSASTDYSTFDSEELPDISPQQKREVKPYFPPTDPEDLQRVLQEPPLR